MEDYIYIILALLWVVFSVIKATKKKPLPPVAEVDEYEEPEGETRSSFDDLIDEFLGTGSQETKQVEPMQPSTQYDDIETFTPEIEKYEELVTAVDKDAIQPVILTEDDQVLELETTSGDMTITGTEGNKGFGLSDSVANDFELRKAIIYSAILHRPYD